MDVLMKACALALIVSVLYQAVSGRNKEFAILLVVLGCVGVLVTAILYMEPIFAFFQKLQVLGNVNSQMFEILLKSMGIGLLAEISTLICNDLGNASMGKALQMLATVVILWLSLPMLNSLLEMISGIIGEV